MLKKYLVLLILPIAIMIGLTACEGPEGPEGPAGPAGPQGDKGDQGEDYPQFAYLGDNASTCGHCHASQVSQWMETGHHEAYDVLVAAGSGNNPYCLQCHTVGWDSEINYGDTTITNYGPDDSGFDDYWGKDDAESMARAHKLEGVQCENCHGPMGPTIYNHQPKMTFASRTHDGDVSVNLCASCHEGQLEEWEQSAHGLTYTRHELDQEGFDGEWGRSSCAVCHTAEGFAASVDPDWMGASFDTYSIIGCVACHDPHDNSNPAHIRSVANQSVLYDANQPATYTGKGVGQLCAQCHHGRRDVANVTNQVENGTGHFGPHSSPQMDMYLGSGSYEIEGMTYDRGSDNTGHKAITEGCVSCHMQTVDSHGRDHHVHEFEPALAACQQCHPSATDFNIGNTQSEFDDLVHQIETLVGVGEHDWGNPDSTTMDQRKALYGAVFAISDGSRGVHNPSYARSLLENSLAYLQNLP